MESALLLDVVIREGASVLQLFSGENQSLLVGRDALLVLNLSLDILDCVARLNLQGDGFPGQGFDEYLHASPEPQHQVESALLLDIVIREGASVLQLFSGENQSLLVGRDALLVLNLSLDILDCVARLNL